MEHYEIIGHKQVNSVLRKGGCIMIVGDVNTGKTTLAHKLFAVASNYHKRIAFLDLDLGQSSTFLPGTLNLSLFKDSGYDKKTYFVGKMSPSGVVEDVLKGVHLFKNYILRVDPKFVVVDTTGYVKGEEALKLKRMKAEILSPSLVIILGWGNEDIVPLFETLNPVLGGRILTFTPSSKVRVRDAEERRKYRESLLRVYFERAYLRKLNINDVSIIWGGYNVEESGFLKSLVGRYTGILGGDGFAVGCGLVKDVVGEEISILTPYDSGFKRLALKIGDPIDLPEVSNLKS